MTPEKIQYELKMRKITQKQIAIEEGKNQMIVSNVIWRKRTSHDVMEAIAKRLGRKPEDVFPDKYGKGQRRRAA